jgi:hypothetical protein
LPPRDFLAVTGLDKIYPSRQGVAIRRIFEGVDVLRGSHVRA